MSWGTCYNGSNNIHFNLPPLMSYGRNFTTLTPARQQNTKVFEKLNMQSNYDYRQYLISNAENLIKKNMLSACDNCCHCERIIDGIPQHQKYFYRDCSDLNKPYGYQDSDLKNMYLTRHQHESKLKAPILTQEQLLQLKSQQQSKVEEQYKFPEHN